MVAMNPLLNQTCRQLLGAFFAKFPNEQLRGDSGGVLLRLLARKVPMPGKAGGWAGGIVYAVGSRGCGVPNVFNRELEEAFGTTMSTIYVRAAQIKRLLDL
jgi:hypothetical protein